VVIGGVVLVIFLMKRRRAVLAKQQEMSDQVLVDVNGKLDAPLITPYSQHQN
jgi:hypothetical protein